LDRFVEWKKLCLRFSSAVLCPPQRVSPGERKAQQRRVCVPGKHRNRDASDVVEEMTGRGIDRATTGANAGKQVTTVEGLSPDLSHPLQRAWIEQDVPQCGYCQSGMIMSVAALRSKRRNPTDAEFDAEITNACRCSTYHRVRKAIRLAASRLSSQGRL